MDLKQSIRQLPDYPKPGIIFFDVTTLLADPQAFQESVDQLTTIARDIEITAVAGIEARGFIFGAPIALALGVKFVPIRKPGKLPAETISTSYELEYGSDTVEMHADALSDSDHVLLVDDLLATGGTIEAAARLVEQTGATVAHIAFVVELLFLHGRDKLEKHPVTSLVTYE